VNFKLGKLPVKIDSRNLKFRSILPVELPPAPPEYDVDFDNQDIWPLPLPTWSNLTYGDCVLAARANMTLRLERLEQGGLIPLTEKEVVDEYFRESGGVDSGLYILDSLKSWRTEGWIAGGQRLNIFAFAEIDHRDHEQVKHGVHLLSGLIAGVSLPKSAIDQIDRNEIWDIIDGPDEIAGGHAVYVIAYTRTGPTLLTWGKRQPCTWAWFDRYCEELYGIVDDRDSFMKDSPLNIEMLDAILKQIAG
jgi:hypothetical protein